MKNLSYLGLGALVLTLGAATGCNNAGPTPPGGDECSDPNTAGCVVASSKQRIQSPDVPAGDLQTLVKGNDTFALDLYQELRGQPGNLFYSPYSISLALGMTWAGARNQTETDMAKALGFSLGQDKLHPAFNALDLALQSRGKNAKASDGKGFRLNIANALWGQTGYQFQAPFLDVLAQNYGAGMHVVDFEGAPNQAVDLINGWVNTATESKIPKLVTPENITSDTKLVLTNAIYFNAAWSTPFDAKNTKDGSFVTADGSKVTVPMMHGSQETGYAKGDGYQAVTLPYDGLELSMLVILPDAGTLSTFEAALDQKKVDDILAATHDYEVTMDLPKFKFDSSFGLRKALDDLGMGVAFSGKADFSGISTQSQLAIQDVIHKSFISVNEAGTEAAAATAVILGDTAAPEPASITVDHPFLFVIRDNATGALLFVGRVVDPSK
jgi:serpin B